MPLVSRELDGPLGELILHLNATRPHLVFNDTTATYSDNHAHKTDDSLEQTSAGMTAAWTPPSAAAVRLQAELDAAVAAGAASFAIPAGDYEFGSASFNLTDARGMYVRAEGAPRLLFALGGAGRYQAISFVGQSSAGMSLIFVDRLLMFAVVVERAESTTLAGPLTIDYVEEPASQSVVTAIGSGCFSTSSPPRVCEIDVRVEEGFPPPDPAVRPDLCYYPACETKLVFFESAPPHNLRQVTTQATCATPCELSGQSSTGMDYRVQKCMHASKHTGSIL